LTELALRRKLAAVFFADVEGYCRLTGLDEEGTYVTVAAYLKSIAEKIESHDGTVGHYSGDAVLADFDTVSNAILCSVAIQRELTKRNEGFPADRQVRFRIGINLGDVIVDHGTVHGEGVNIAARLECLADPGGICISGTAYDAVGTSLPVAYEFIGEQTLKNIDRPVRAYRVILDEGIDPGRTRPGKSQEVPVRPAIAVLPFENLGHLDEHDYFCDGLTQDVTTDLAKFSDLFVITAKSAFQYRNASIEPKQLGKILGARYLLTGSVLRVDQRVRVNAQLIEAETGYQIWSERFDRELSDIFVTQDELVRRVVSSTSARVSMAERTYAIRMDPKNVNAYDAFLRGNHHWWQFWNVEQTKKEWTESRKWFRRATRLDRSYARAWAWYAYSTVEGVQRGWETGGTLVMAEEQAERAVQLDPFDYDTHWALGFCYHHRRKFDQSISEYSRAYELNRSDPDLMIEMAETLTLLGRHSEAVSQLEQAINLETTATDYCRATLAWALYFLGKYGDSLLQLSLISHPSRDSLKTLAASHAQNAKTHAEGGQAVIANDECASAETAMRQVLKLLPDWTAEKERKYRVFKEERDANHWLDGLRSAGLPEG
jgi:TolB-like protein